MGQENVAYVYGYLNERDLLFHVAIRKVIVANFVR